MLVDLHMHSTFSDGRLSPQELVDQGRLHGLSVMALTDHDEIAGIRPMQAYAGSDMTIIAGTELSASYKGKDVHILGYDFDLDSPILQDYIRYYQDKRKERIVKMIDLCQQQGYAISMEELLALAPDTKAYGRPHIAQLLVQKGYAKDTNEVFDKILSSGGSCYVPKVKESVSQVIDVIHDAGGMAILAHPKLIRNDDYVRDILRFPLDGLEVYHTSHGLGEEDRYRAMAEARDLLITGGSDFHGIEGRNPATLGGYTVESELIQEFMDQVL